MSVIIFIIILSALIIVHELGHFLVARKFGIRVDEFGLGFPPRARKLFTWKGTPFTLNWLPFGGFVKIFGENPEQSTSNAPSDSFQSKSRGIQASVLLAGVLGNFIFAWSLISIGFIVGLPTPAGLSIPIENPRTVITTVLPDSPAALAGLKSGDAILSLDGHVVSPEEAVILIGESSEPITFEIERGGAISSRVVEPKEGIIADKPAVGITMDVIGIAKLTPHKAIWQGLETASELTLLTGQGILSFLSESFRGKADLSGITGPVGIVGLVGEARELGFTYLLTFTALISINLTIINLLPFPALDGGRLLFVGIEALTRRPVSARIFNTVNVIGFALLLLLMLVVTVQDIRNIF